MQDVACLYKFIINRLFKETKEREWCKTCLKDQKNHIPSYLLTDGDSWLKKP